MALEREDLVVVHAAWDEVPLGMGEKFTCTLQRRRNCLAKLSSAEKLRGFDGNVACLKLCRRHSSDEPSGDM